jgi:hypothetical protein
VELHVLYTDYHGTPASPIFCVVGEALSFTRAAARLRVAQPASSRQVQDLENEIGVDLLRRGPRGVTLTAEGRLFFGTSPRAVEAPPYFPANHSADYDESDRSPMADGQHAHDFQN